MRLNELRPQPGAVKKRKRLGTGTSAGTGGTCTRGHKGHSARSGSGKPAWFEGGQMPLQRRVPKRGFKNPTRRTFQVINVADLDRFEAGAVVGIEELRAAGLVRQGQIPVKLLGTGSIDRALTVKVHAASKSALEKVSQGGGKVEILA
jgi:large subunit ribosomal protein L15